MCTARNSVGMAAEASTQSAVMRSCRLLNARNRPERTSTAPSSSIGWTPAVSASIRSKSMWRCSISRNCSTPIDVVGRWYGLTAGSSPKLCTVLAMSIHELRSRPAGPVAALSAQNSSSRRPARARSSSSSADQASSAQTAPPEVPLSPTIR